MNYRAEDQLFGAVLCGGRSERFGSLKAFANLQNQTLLEHVLTRLEPQVQEFVLSVPEAAAPWTNLNHVLVPDRVQSHRGPLSGLSSCLNYLHANSRSDWLLLVPCDAPFLPLDLGRRLLSAAREQNVTVASARAEGVIQPTFSLWHRQTLVKVENKINAAGRGGLMAMLDDIPHAAVDWPAQDSAAFFNVNAPADLTAAESLLDAV